MDCLIERVLVGEGLMGEVIGLEIMPDDLDVVEFGCVFGQPLDSKPVRAISDGGERAFAGVDRAIVYDRRGRASWLRAVKLVELFEMSDEVAATLGRAGMHDELARDVIQRAHHCDLLGLSRRGHAPVRSGFRPDRREIRMRQRFALVAVKKTDVARHGLLFTQLQAQADTLHLIRILAPLQAVPGPSPTILFFRNALDNCERLMRTPSRASISARRRGIVQLGLSAHNN